MLCYLLAVGDKIGLLFIGAFWICAIASAAIASSKNRTGWGFFLLGLLLGPIAIFMAINIGPGRPPVPAGLLPVICPRCNAAQNVAVAEASYECWQCKLVVYKTP